MSTSHNTLQIASSREAALQHCADYTLRNWKSSLLGCTCPMDLLSFAVCAPHIQRDQYIYAGIYIYYHCLELLSFHMHHNIGMGESKSRLCTHKVFVMPFFAEACAAFFIIYAVYSQFFIPNYLLLFCV